MENQNQGNSPDGHSGGGGSNSFGDFMSFNKMISLNFIQIIYIVGAIGITLFSLYIMFAGSRMMGGTAFLMGLVYLTVGNLFWRVSCELIIIQFRIARSVSNIEKNCNK